MYKLIEKKHTVLLLLGVVLILIGLLSPFLWQYSWLNTIGKIREAIKTGDSGHLILAAASMSFLFAVQSTFLFLGAMLVVYCSKNKSAHSKLMLAAAAVAAVIFFHLLDALMFEVPWEPVSTLLALAIIIFLFDRIFVETNSFVQVSIVTVQVFFAFQWLNIMPLFSTYSFGQSDVSNSIKIAGTYLQASSVLNFTGFAFFLPFIFSAFITSTLFISYSRNISMMKENFEKESEIQSMKAKALENRIYKEVKSLVHDLKTPLVTVRGLNSLLATAKDQTKLMEYSSRMENSISKMNEMISSFLYESSRQRIEATELISYVRAQLPLEDDTIQIDIRLDEALPDIYVNKIRIARAIINILENAIVVPCRETNKKIRFIVSAVSGGINIVVQDNGIGISETDMAYIWEVGFSTNNTSGLGLPFARQVIEYNGGTINLASEVNVGTTVTIFLPSAESYYAEAAKLID
ncbi:MAG: sensor histidine kinase [Bacillota bacterium]